MKTVMVFGTFDILHPGHKYFLQQAKKYGDYLIVVIARDSTVKKVKGKLPQNNKKQRLGAIIGLNLADKAVLGNKRDKYAVIRKYRPDVICLGYDQKYFIENLVKKLRQYNLTKTKIIRLKPYKAHKYKTSII